MPNQPLISAPESLKELVQTLIVERARVPLFGRRDSEDSYMTSLFKADPVKASTSNKGQDLGRVQHPFNMDQARVFLNTNEYHASCIQTKTQATVGLGFKLDTSQGDTPTPTGTGQPNLASMRPAAERLASKVDLALDPLCENSFQDVLSSVGEDFWAVGGGYMEVIRDESETITGLHHLPAPDVFFYIENELGDYHFEIVNAKGVSGSTLHFAKFGDRKSFIQRWGGENTLDPTKVSEVIHFRCPTSLDRRYGFPTWIAATPLMELAQCLMQYKYDYFLNRGVPEFMLFITGQKLSPDDWKKVENALKANIGLGNTHKSLALNLENAEINIQLEKLAMENTSDENFATTSDNIALRIVSTHRVPPLLAGILIPGKLGATNELPNALMGFQALNCGPAQRLFQQTLGRTLGSPEAGLKLTLTDFEFFTILDEVDIGLMQTTSQMRQTIPEAKAQGRDLGKGLKQ